MRLVGADGSGVVVDDGGAGLFAGRFSLHLDGFQLLVAGVASLETESNVSPTLSQRSTVN